MATKTKQAPYTTIKFERESGPTENRRLYAVEKTKDGTLLFFTENEVLEAKHLFHDTHDKIAADGPLRSSANLDDRFFAYCNDWLFALPDDLCADRIFFLRRCSPEGMKRHLCTHLNSNKILSAPVNADQVSLSSEELSIATLLAELDVPIYEIQTKDDQSWIVELLQPRPYTPAEAKKYLPANAETKRRGKPPASQSEKKKDAELLTEWQSFCVEQADSEENNKPTYKAFAARKGLPVQDVKSTFDRVRKRKRDLDTARNTR